MSLKQLYSRKEYPLKHNRVPFTQANINRSIYSSFNTKNVLTRLNLDVQHPLTAFYKGYQVLSTIHLEKGLSLFRFSLSHNGKPLAALSDKLPVLD